MYSFSGQVASAKETSKDLLQDMADTIRRIKRIGAKNKDIWICKSFQDLPIATFKFLCNQYGCKAKFEYSRFNAFFDVDNSTNHYIKFESEKQEIELKEIETL